MKTWYRNWYISYHANQPADKKYWAYRSVFGTAGEVITAASRDEIKRKIDAIENKRIVKPV